MIVVLLVFAFGVGRPVIRALGGWRDRDLESLALACAAGLGLVALMFAIPGLIGQLSAAPAMALGGAIATVIGVGPAAAKSLAALRQGPGMPGPYNKLRSFPTLLLLLMVVCAAAGALTPVTEFDSLAYSMPIVRHLVDAGAWRFWPDQVLSVFPLSQELLTVPLWQAGEFAPGLLSAAELVLAAILIVALARRVSRQPHAPAIAAIITLGCPAVAFIAASMKPDLLLMVMTVAAAISLVSSPGWRASVATGLFAGFAAGTKLTGAPIAFAAIACVPWGCGRTRPLRHVALAAITAVAAGGLWYVVDFVRFGNPVPLMSLGPWFHTPLQPEQVLNDVSDGFGRGRSIVDALIAPIYLAVGDERFGGRGNWINVLPFLGVAAALVRGLRRDIWMLVALAAVSYVAWFSQVQVGRLLLPALALLSVPAAELIARAWSRTRLARPVIALALIASAGVVAATGLLRVERYVREPSTFLQRETPYYDAIAWMNSHLDPARDRVAASYEPAGYLQIPWLALNPAYQIAISAAEMDDPARLRTALAREHVTYLFGPPDAFKDLGDMLEPVYENPTSRVGGSSFFRQPRTAPIAVYKLKN